MYHKKEGKFYTIRLVTKVATICVRYVPQKRRQLMYYTDVTPATADPMFSISDTDISI